MAFFMYVCIRQIAARETSFFLSLSLSLVRDQSSCRTQIVAQLKEEKNPRERETSIFFAGRK